MSQSRGKAIDENAFNSGVEASTQRVVRQPGQTGLDLANNSEQSRPSFFTAAGADRVHPEVVWEKLKSLKEGVELASQSRSW